jgi:hypothetical protein
VIDDSRESLILKRAASAGDPVGIIIAGLAQGPNEVTSYSVKIALHGTLPKTAKQRAEIGSPRGQSWFRSLLSQLKYSTLTRPIFYKPHTKHSPKR